MSFVLVWKRLIPRTKTQGYTPFRGADGDADKAKAIYIKHRVDDISAGFTAMANEQIKRDWLDSRAKTKEEKAKEKELAYRAKVAGTKYIKK